MSSLSCREKLMPSPVKDQARDAVESAQDAVGEPDGPFSLGAPGVIEAAYERAGFRNVEVRKVPSPLRLSSAKECVRFESALRSSCGGLLRPLLLIEP